MSKLSRKGKSKNVKTSAATSLDDSASEFSSLCTPIQESTIGTQQSQTGIVISRPAQEIVACQSSSTNLRSSVFEETVEEAVDEAVETSVCPVCGKLGAGGAHVKTCGSRHGLTTSALIEAVRLTERQGKERKALGLPRAPIQEKPRVKVAKTKRVKKAAKEDNGADPGTELAIALSISELQQQQDEVVVSKYFGAELKKEGKQAVAEGSRDKEGRMWLPQTSSSPQKRKKRGKGRGGHKETTVLQLRTEDERTRLLGEKVSDTLIETTAQSSRLPLGNCKDSVSHSHFWLLPSKLNTLASQNLIARGLSRFLSLSNNLEEGETEQIAPPNPSYGPLATLSTAWLSLLKSGSGADTVFLCKGEAELRCHSLVLNTRSTKILSDAVLETSEDGKAKHMLILNDFEVAAVRLLLRFIYGGVLDCEAVTSREVLAQVRKLGRMWNFPELVGWVEQVEVQEEEGTEELDGVGDGFAVGSVEEEEEGGTQCLDALLDHLDEEDADGDRLSVEGGGGEDEMEEWDSVCQYMTQRVRNSIAEEIDENAETETQSLSGESSEEGFEGNFDAGTEIEYLSLNGKAQRDNSSDKENNSPLDNKISPPMPLKPIPCFALLERSGSLPPAPSSPSNSSAPPCASSTFLSVHGGPGQRSFSSPQVTRINITNSSQLACPPSPDMFDSDWEEEGAKSREEVEEGAKSREGEEEDHSRLSVATEENENELSSSLKRKSDGQIGTLGSKRVKTSLDLQFNEELPTPTKYSPIPPICKSSPLALSQSPISLGHNPTEDPPIDLTQSSTSSRHRDEDDDYDLELPTPTKYSPFPKKVNDGHPSSIAENSVLNPPGTALMLKDASTMEEIFEDEEGVFAELSLLTARLSAKGATEEETSACLVCLLSLQVRICTSYHKD